MLSLDQIPEILSLDDSKEQQKIKKSPLPGISIDSRSLQKGDIFFAIKGKEQDGHAYVEKALEAGASLTVVNKDFSDVTNPRIIHVDNPLATLHALARKVREHYNPVTIAVTGSVGKTTTKNYAGSLFSAISPTISSKKSFNNEFGIPLTLLEINNETQFACIEIGINTIGEMEQLSPIISPDIAVITNIGLAHVGRLGSLETILAEKAKLLNSLRPDGTAVLNADDENLASLTPGLKEKNINVLWFGTSAIANVQIASRRIENGTQELEIHTPKGNIQITAMPEDTGTMYACLAGVSAAIASGLDLDTIEEATTKTEFESRLKIVPFKKGRIIDDTYNASLASVLNGVALIKETGENPLFVLGDLREIGDYLVPSYKEILNAVESIGGEIIAVGETGESWQEAVKLSGTKPEMLSVTDRWDQAIEILTNRELPDNTAIFIKASRFSHLERIALFMEDIKSTCHKVSCSKYIHCSVCEELAPE